MMAPDEDDLLLIRATAGVAVSLRALQEIALHLPGKPGIITVGTELREACALLRTAEVQLRTILERL